MPTARELYRYVTLVTDVDPLAVKIAVTEFSSGITPTDIAAVGLDAFGKAASRLVAMKTADTDAGWPFAEERLKKLQDEHAAAREREDVKRAMASVREARAEVSEAASEAGIDEALRGELLGAIADALKTTREEQAELLNRLRVGMTPDFEIWETVALMMGRALRGELRGAFRHTPLNAESVSRTLTRYLGADASPDTVWEDCWERQKVLLGLGAGVAVQR